MGGQGIRRLAVATVITMMLFALSASASEGGDATPTTSPANGRIVFTRSDNGVWRICSINRDGGDPQFLTGAHAQARHPSFSADGSKIVFVGEKTGKSQIYEMNADGSGKHQLTFGRISLHPAYSPDGSKIVFSRYDPGGYSDIFEMNADGSSTHRVADLPQGNDSDPSFSPDGTSILFEHITDEDIGVAVMDADESDLRDLTTRPDDDFAFQPDFSPSGDEITYVADDRHFRFQIRLMDADGTNRHKLGTEGDAPTFSPDGRLIAYTRDSLEAPKGRAGVYVKRPDGTHRRMISNFHAIGPQGVDWAPALP